MNTQPTPDQPLEDTRQRLITAAMQLFGQVGYTQATTRLIAQAAGVNEVTLFRQFGSKKGLVMACIDAHNAAGFTATFEAELTGSYPDDIRRMAELQVADTAANLEVLRLLVCDARNLPELRQALLAGGRSNLARLSAYFQRQIDLGVVRPAIPAELLASAFDSLFSTPVIFENLFQDALSPNLPTPAALQSLVDLFVRGTQAAAEK
jgi:AcrR family transcriptional regulator